MSAIDPTKYRLSDSLLLSDAIGNHSAYSKGLANPVTDEFEDQLKEGKHLAEYLDSLQDELGPYRVSYGFIHPELSEAIVRWKPGHLPSYHRWDDGAAMDVCFVHRDRFFGGLGHWDDSADAPINTALWIHNNVKKYSRMITYCQSEWMCIATKRAEGGIRNRLAFYENRFMPDGTCKYIKHHPPDGDSDVPEYLALDAPWRGQGHPPKGKEYQHVKVSATTFLSDYLYNKHKVHKGIPNLPPVNGFRPPFMRNLQRAGRIIDRLTEHFRYRFSIVQAYDANKPEVFVKGFDIQLVPSVHVDHESAADFIADADPKVKVKIASGPKAYRRIRMSV